MKTASKYGIDVPIRTAGIYGLYSTRACKAGDWAEAGSSAAPAEGNVSSIHAAAEKEDAEIFLGDETVIKNVINYACGCAPKGRTHVLKMEARKIHINMISAIINLEKPHFMFGQESVNQQKMIEYPWATAQGYSP